MLLHQKTRFTTKTENDNLSLLFSFSFHRRSSGTGSRPKRQNLSKRFRINHDDNLTKNLIENEGLKHVSMLLSLLSKNQPWWQLDKKSQVVSHGNPNFLEELKITMMTTWEKIKELEPISAKLRKKRAICESSQKINHDDNLTKISLFTRLKSRLIDRDSGFLKSAGGSTRFEDPLHFCG